MVKQGPVSEALLRKFKVRTQYIGNFPQLPPIRLGLKRSLNTKNRIRGLFTSTPLNIYDLFDIIVAISKKEFNKYYAKKQKTIDYSDGMQNARYQTKISEEKVTFEEIDEFSFQSRYLVKAPTRPAHGSFNDLVDANTIITSAMVDAFNFSYISDKNSHIFTALQNDGYSSPLISFFSTCEKESKLPIAEDYKLKTVPFTEGAGELRKVIGSVFKEYLVFFRFFFIGFFSEVFFQIYTPPVLDIL